jgi:voltage-gated potassium channel
MSKLRDHFIICGAGRVGSHLIRGLLGSADTFIVIERDPQKVAELTDLGVIVLVRDATLEESLREAGVEHARGLAACLPDDADNVYVVLTARDLNPQLHIVARAVEEQAESKLIRAGANRVVAPTIIGGHRMAMALTKPAVDDFLGSITANKLELAFEQLEVDARSTLAGQKLSETNIRSDLDIVVVSIRRSDGQILFNPSGDALIQSGDILIAIGHAESLMKLADLAKGASKSNVQSPMSKV